MKTYSLTNLSKILARNLESLRYNNKIFETQRKLINPSFLEIMEELVKDDSALAVSLFNWYIAKYGETIDDNIDLKDLLKTAIEEKKKDYSEYTGCGSAQTIIGGCGGYYIGGSC